jgi:hypothetical protein
MAEQQVLAKETQRGHIGKALDDHFLTLHEHLKSTVLHHAERMSDGKISAEEFEKRVRTDLRSAYDKAAQLGKVKARGEYVQLSQRDLAAVNRQRYEDNKFLKGFIEDIHGKYQQLEPEKAAARVQWRAQQYADALQGTMNESFVAHMPEETLYDWVLTEGADHCEDCLAAEAGSPYKRATLPFTPGDGSCACVENCLCSLVARTERTVQRETATGVKSVTVKGEVSGAPVVAPASPSGT